MPSTDHLVVSHMNINSLRRKRDVVIKYIEDVKPLIIAISETWLDPNFPTSHVQIDGYNLVRNDRGLKNKNKTRYMQAGGVACYIHQSFTSKVLFMSKISNIAETEFLVLEIASSSAAGASKLLLAVVYRHEEGHVLTEFFNVIDDLAQSYKNIIILGDFNVNVLKNTFHSRHLIDAINERSLYLVPYGATNFSNNAATSIDLAIVDSSSKLVSFSKTDSPIAAGHLAINLVYKFVTDKISNKTITYRNFRSCDNKKMSEDVVSALSCNPFMNHIYPDPSSIVNYFSEVLQNSLDCHAPYVTRSMSRRSAPWITADIKKLCKERDVLYKRARRLGSAELLKIGRAHV